MELSETTIPTGGTVPLEISMVDSTFEELFETTIPTGGTLLLEILMVDSTFICPGGFELSEEGSYGGSDESY